MSTGSTNAPGGGERTEADWTVVGVVVVIVIISIVLLCRCHDGIYIIGMDTCIFSGLAYFFGGRLTSSLWRLLLVLCGPDEPNYVFVVGPVDVDDADEVNCLSHHILPILYSHNILCKLNHRLFLFWIFGRVNVMSTSESVESVLSIEILGARMQ
jgi:hypothetical protein